MTNLIDFPRTNRAASEAQAFLASPRGRFLKACSVLNNLGYERTATDAVLAYREGFSPDHAAPNLSCMVLAFAGLASIPTADHEGVKFARIGLTALCAIAYPFDDDETEEAL